MREGFAERKSANWRFAFDMGAINYSFINFFYAADSAVGHVAKPGRAGPTYLEFSSGRGKAQRLRQADY